MGILNSLNIKKYNASWREISCNHLDEDDYSIISDIEIVPSNHGVSGLVTYVSGEVAYFPVSQRSCEVAVGEHISPARCSIVVLKRLEATCTKLLIDEE